MCWLKLIGEAYHYASLLLFPPGIWANSYLSLVDLYFHTHRNAPMTFIKNREKINDGVAFTSKKVLQYAVILLGFGMNLSVVISIGLQSLPIIITTISASLLIAYALFKIMKMPTNISVLVGVGSICGGISRCSHRSRN